MIGSEDKINTIYAKEALKEDLHDLQTPNYCAAHLDSW